MSIPTLLTLFYLFNSLAGKISSIFYRSKESVDYYTFNVSDFYFYIFVCLELYFYSSSALGGLLVDDFSPFVIKCFYGLNGIGWSGEEALDLIYNGFTSYIFA